MHWIPSTWAEWEAATTIGALLVGGFWTWLLFVRGRQKWPQAKIEHHFQLADLDEGRVLLNARVGIENVGKRLIKVERIKTRVQRVAPQSDLVRKQLGVYQEAKAPRVSWPEIAQRNLEFAQGGEIEVEPGESDWIEFDYVLPKQLKVLRFYSFVDNSKKKRRHWWNKKEALGWTRSSLLNLVAERTRDNEKREEKAMSHAVTPVNQERPSLPEHEEKQQVVEQDPPREQETLQEQETQETDPPKETDDQSD